MKTTPPDSLQMTYQQLEELDGLLQRMLAMTQRSTMSGSNCKDTASVSHGLTYTESSPTTAQLSVQHQVNMTVECIRNTDNPEINTPTNHMLTVNTSHSHKNILRSEQPTLSDDSMELPLAEELVEKQTCSDDHMYYVLLLFVYINHIYDKICVNLGCIGRLLCASITRNTLGISGLLLLFYSMLWYTQSQELIGWNVSVPWTLQDWYDIIGYRQ